MAGALQILRHDHENVRLLGRILDGMAGAVHMGVPVDAVDVRQVLSLVGELNEKGFRRHEERGLYPMIKRHGRALANLIPALKGQQAILKKQVQRMNECAAAAPGDIRAAVAFERAARIFASVLREHIVDQDVKVLAVVAEWTPVEREALGQALAQATAPPSRAAANAMRHASEALAHKYARFGAPTA